jgi:hypothetical protein
MSKQALAVATALGKRLPRFASAAAARRALFTERDEALRHLASLDGAAWGFVADRTVDSLRALERFYFALHPRKFARVGTDRARLEDAMAYYLGAVAVKVAGARWLVAEYPFARGRYEIGVATKSQTVMVGGACDRWHERRPNARRDALRRQFLDWWASARPVRKTSRPAVDDAAIAREIERVLGLRSSPALMSGALVDVVRHNLESARLRFGQILAVADSLVRSGRLEKVPCERRSGWRYRRVTKA